MLLDNVVGTPHHAIALWVLCIMDAKVLANRASAKVVWLARPSHLIAGALRAGRDVPSLLRHGRLSGTV